MADTGGLGGKLGKLKAKLAILSQRIDESDQRKADAKANIIEALSRLEKAESEAGSVDRRLRLLGQDLKVATDRCDEVTQKLEKVESEGAEIEERRKELEENENAGDEKISSLEEQVRATKLELEGNHSKFTELSRKNVVVSTDCERARTNADALEKRVEELESTISSSTASIKELEERDGEYGLREEKNIEGIMSLEAKYKEAEVRAEASTRSIQVIGLNLQETQAEIDEWVKKTDEMVQEVHSMNDLADEIDIE